MNDNISNLRNCRAVLFDLDDTLVNTTDAYTNALRIKLPELGLMPGDESVHHAFFLIGRMRSYNIEDAFIALLREQGVEPQQARDRALALHNPFNNLMLENLHPLPGAIDLLDYLVSKKVKLGLVTNGHSTWQRDKLAASGLETYFDKQVVVVTGELPRYSDKPSQYVYSHVLKLLGKEAGEVAFAGDRYTDVLGANVAGMFSIMVGTGRHKEYDSNSPLECPDLWVDDLIMLKEKWME